MRKFLYGVLFLLLAVAASTAVNVALASCDNPRVKQLAPTVNKAVVQDCLDSIVNPVFTSMNDVFELQKELKTNAFIDSVFMSMPQDVLKNVSSVVMGKRHYVTKDDIVGEFLQNRQIYENLPGATPPDNVSDTNSSTTKETKTPIPGVVIKETTTVTEAPPTGVESGSANSYKDTVIDGKHALIQH